MPNVLQLVLEVNNSQGNRSIDGFNQSLSSMEQRAIRSSQGAARALGGIDQAAVRASASVRQSFGGLGTILSVAGITTLGKSIFDIAAGFEQARIGIKAFLGDAQKANALFDDIQKFALESPFQFKDLLVGAQRLLAFKTEAKDIIPTLKAISATIGATGGDQGSFDSLIKALGDIRNRGKVTGEEIRQLTNQGVPAIRLLAEGFGKSTAEITKAISDGIVPADAAIRVLVRGMTKEFGVFNDEVSKTGKTALSNFFDGLQKLANDGAEKFLPAITQGINDLRAGLGTVGTWVKENQNTLGSIAVGLGEIGAAIVAFKVVSSISAVTDALVALRAASLANPWALAIAGATLVTVELYRTNKAFQELEGAKIDDSIVRGLVRQGKTAKEIEDLGIAAGKSGEQMKAALTRVGGQGDFSGAAKELGKAYGIVIDGAGKAKDTVEQFDTTMRDQAAAATKVADAEKRAAEILDQAKKREFGGLAQIIEEYRQYRTELGLSQKANLDLNQAVVIRIRTESLKQLRDNAKDTVRQIDEERQVRSDFEAEQFKKALENSQQIREMRIANVTTAISQEETLAAASRDSQLRALEGLSAVTVEQKVAVEQRKAEIERAFLLKSLDLKIQMLDNDETVELARAAGNTDLRLAIEEKFQLARRALNLQTDAEVAATTENAAIRSTGIVRENTKRIFDSFKHSAEGVFDALLTKSQSVWQALGNSLKTALLTAIKEIVTSRIAAALTQLFTGANVSLAGLGGGNASFSGGSASGGGILGRLGGILGIGALGGGSPVFGSGSILGGPGGTSGVAGPVSVAAGPGGSNAGSLGGLGGLLGLKGGLSSASLGALALGGSALGLQGALKLGQSGGLAGKIGAPLLGAFSGLVGFGGLSAMFPALIAAGPVGWIAAAGIGAAIGLMGVFRKTAEQKLIEKVKQVHQADIDKTFAKQLLEIIKTSYAGNIDVGLASPQITELITLYKMAHGQNVGISNIARPLFLNDIGGQVFQAPSYQNGQSFAYGGGSLPVMGDVSRLVAPQASQPTTIIINVPGAKQFFEDETLRVVTANGDVVAGAANSGYTDNAGRLDAAVLQREPGLLLA